MSKVLVDQPLEAVMVVVFFEPIPAAARLPGLDHGVEIALENDVGTAAIAAQ